MNVCTKIQLIEFGYAQDKFTRPEFTLKQIYYFNIQIHLYLSNDISRWRRKSSKLIKKNKKNITTAINLLYEGTFLRVTSRIAKGKPNKK